jgi:hypothetical protein
MMSATAPPVTTPMPMPVSAHAFAVNGWRVWHSAKASRLGQEVWPQRPTRDGVRKMNLDSGVFCCLT